MTHPTDCCSIVGDTVWHVGSINLFVQQQPSLNGKCSEDVPLGRVHGAVPALLGQVVRHLAGVGVPVGVVAQQQGRDLGCNVM